MDRPLENIKRWYAEISRFTGGVQGTSEDLEWMTNPFDDWYGGDFGVVSGCSADRFQWLIAQAAKGAADQTMAQKLVVLEPEERRFSEEELECLSRCGFVEEMSQVGMVIELGKMETLGGWDLRGNPEPADASADFRILRAASEEEITAWAQVAEEAFEAAEHHQIIHCFARDPKFRLYLGVCGDQPAAGALAYCSEDEVGLYLVGTVPGFRRRGLADQVVKTALRDAEASGLKWGVLQASSMGEPVYRRIGFRPTGRISHWNWEPKS